MNPKVSVIVPVHNTEKYLDKCLNSLVNQTLDEIEIIVVNDGSPDNSQAIIDKYSKEHPSKIVALTKMNGGLGDARNFGLEYAKGEFIGFVDSDDWVDTEMYETMYKSVKAGHDMVLCDCVVVINEKPDHTAKGFRGPSFDYKNAIMYSTDPALACNKLFKRQLFEILTFPLHWYEDIGITPVLMTYSNSIGYVESPLYYYRQREDSITNSSSDKTLGVIQSWERILLNANPQYMCEAIFAVCNSISIFMDFKLEHMKKFIEFIEKNKLAIQNNLYYTEAVKNGRIKDLLSLVAIPKKIHYCWFGKGPKTELACRCIETWKEKLPDYELIEWNETNCDINEIPFVKQAYEAKKWAFVADYFRLKAIYEHGGLYFDTDLEVTNQLDMLMINKVFFAFETNDYMQSAIFGAVKGAEVIKKLMESYKTEQFINTDKTLNTKTNVVRLTEILTSEYNLLKNGEYQILKDGITIYPANILTLNAYDGNNYAIHHYEASWWDVKTGPSWKEVVLKSYFKEKLLSNSATAPEIDVSIIIFLKNTVNNLKEKIDSILSSKNFINFEIILVNDDPIVESMSLFKTHINKDLYKNVILIETNGIGCGAGKNTGAKVAKGRYLFFCDVDIEVSDMWLDCLVYTLKSSDANLVSPCIVDPFNSLISVYGTTWNSELQSIWLTDKPKDLTEIPLTSNAILGITKEAFNKIHGFIEYFHQSGLENQELCFKAWLYGYKLVINPESEIKYPLTNIRPYQEINADIIHDIIYLSYLHFSKKRLMKVIKMLKRNHGFSYSVLAIKFYIDIIINQRESYFNERLYNDDFFFKKFNISF